MSGKMNWEKVNRTRKADYGTGQLRTISDWFRSTAKYPGVCVQCGGPTIAGSPVWLRKQKGKWQHKHIGHSKT